MNKDPNLFALKWVAVLLMTGDHVNKYLFNGTLPVLFELGRACLPIFVFVLAYNLARPKAMPNGIHSRLAKRLIVTGLIATPPFIALGGLLGGWWPLNIMFTLLTLVITIYCIERCTKAFSAIGALAFIAGGAMVEFWWPAIVLGLSVWAFLRNHSFWPVAIGFAALLSLSIINGNQWALLSVVFIAAAYFCSNRDSWPRFTWLFYAYYPAHLAIIWCIRIPMRKAGYFFLT